MMNLRTFILVSISISLLSACQKNTDNQTITFSAWGSPEEMAIVKPLIQKFEAQNPDIKVNLMHIPDKYFQKLHTLIAANLTPDVMLTNNINFPVYASNQAFVDLQPYLAKSKTLKAKDFYPQTLTGFTWQGQLQGIPRDVSNLVFFYNKDLFDKYRVPYPTANWSWEDFVIAAQKLTQDTNQDGEPEVYGVSFDKRPLFWLPYLWSHGADLFDATRQHSTFNTQQAAMGLQRYADLRHHYKVAPTAAQAGSSTMAQLFMQERVAMQLNGRWAVPLYRQNIKFRWDIAPFPRGTNGSVVDVDAAGWAIAKTSKHPDKAWRLVEYLAGKEATQALTRPGLIVPARKDVAESEAFLAPDQPPASAKVFLKAIDSGVPTPSIPYWNEVLEVLDSELESVWDGQKKAAEALPKVQERLQRLL